MGTFINLYVIFKVFVLVNGHILASLLQINMLALEIF